MTCGDDLCGDSPCGDDTQTFVADAVVTMQGGLYFDGNTRDFPLTETGHNRSIHPIDSEVLVAMELEFGKIAAAPIAGNTYRRIRSGADSRIKSDVDNRTRTALRALLQRRAIKILLIQYELLNRHALAVGLTYINLATTEEKNVALLSKVA